MKNSQPLRMIAIPGKLMLGGEYAVLRSDGACVAVAVGVVVRAQLGLATPAPALELQAFGQSWQWAGGQAPETGLAQLCAAALEALRDRHGISPAHDLDFEVGGNVGGAKVGLGTSAAVTVAALRAALQSHSLATGAAQWAPADIAALARSVHGAGQAGRGSGYDVTVIAHGGVIWYEREPDRATALAWPQGLYGAALFTGSPAATGAALARAAIPDAALDDIRNACLDLHAAWSGPVRHILRALSGCEAAFDVAAAADPGLLPAEVQDLRDLIAECGCVARTSGAGGGDCVLALADDPERVQMAVQLWRSCAGSTVARLPEDLAPAS